MTPPARANSTPTVRKDSPLGTSRQMSKKQRTSSTSEVGEQATSSPKAKEPAAASASAGRRKRGVSESDSSSSEM